MSVDDENNNVIREIQEDQGQDGSSEPRKTNREIAAERREAMVDKFKVYQDRAAKKLRDRKVVNLRSKPLSQLKEGLKRLSDDFNFNIRGIDGSMRLYLGKGKTERDVNMANQESQSILKKLDK